MPKTKTTTSTLYCYVSKPNSAWVRKMAKTSKMSYSNLVNAILTDLRKQAKTRTETRT